MLLYIRWLNKFKRLSVGIANGIERIGYILENPQPEFWATKNFIW